MDNWNPYKSFSRAEESAKTAVSAKELVQVIESFSSERILLSLDLYTIYA